jgi:hypothetical protein
MSLNEEIMPQNFGIPPFTDGPRRPPDPSSAGEMSGAGNLPRQQISREQIRAEAQRQVVERPQSAGLDRQASGGLAGLSSLVGRDIVGTNLDHGESSVRSEVAGTGEPGILDPTGLMGTSAGFKGGLGSLRSGNDSVPPGGAANPRETDRAIAPDLGLRDLQGVIGSSSVHGVLTAESAMPGAIVDGREFGLARDPARVESSPAGLDTLRMTEGIQGGLAEKSIHVAQGEAGLAGPANSATGDGSTPPLGGGRDGPPPPGAASLDLGAQCGGKLDETIQREQLDELKSLNRALSLLARPLPAEPRGGRPSSAR